MTSTSLRSGLVALAFALLAAPAFAQTPPPADGPGRHGQDGQRMHEMMQKHREQRAHDLHAILNIHPDQEAAFSTFEASMTRPPHEQRMKHDRGAMMAMTTPQKLDMMQARMAEHMQRMQQHIAAIKTFYAALSPQQQQAFDALHRMHDGMGMGGHGMHGGGHWGGHDGMMMHGAGDGAPPPPGA
jgi:protein CpxP